MPPQSPSSLVLKEMASASRKASSASKIVISIHFLINLLLSTSLNMIWSLMNAM